MTGTDDGDRRGGGAGLGSHGSDLEQQRAYWNAWNADKQKRHEKRISKRQREVVLGWLDQLPMLPDREILDLGCGAGWFLPDLQRYGRLTAIDFAEGAIALARQQPVAADFVVGDFMVMDLGERRFDVIVCLEVLSHVADHQAFVAKLKRLIRPGGLLMLATQNRPVLERWNDVAPPEGQLRRWFDAAELRTLLDRQFEIEQLFSVSPIASRGLMRVVNSEYLNAPLRLLAGNSLDRWKERMGWGWTLMALARPKNA